MRPIEGIVPPGGWYFYDGDVKIAGEDFATLLRKAEQYRAQNSIPLGDLKTEVATQLCTRNPHFCHGTEQVQPAGRSPVPLNDLMEDVGQWAKNSLVTEAPYTLVTDADAERRARVCVNCPNNQPWQGGCSVCISTIERNSALVRQGRDTPTSRILGGCAAFRHDNRSAVFMSLDNFKDKPKLPDACWLK